MSKISEALTLIDRAKVLEQQSMYRHGPSPHGSYEVWREGRDREDRLIHQLYMEANVLAVAAQIEARCL